MEYSPAAKIIKSLKEKQKLIDAPPAPSTDSKIDLKDCKVNTAEKRSNCHKHF